MAGRLKWEIAYKVQNEFSITTSHFIMTITFLFCMLFISNIVTIWMVNHLPSKWETSHFVKASVAHEGVFGTCALQHTPTHTHACAHAHTHTHARTHTPFMEHDCSVSLWMPRTPISAQNRVRHRDGTWPPKAEFSGFFSSFNKTHLVYSSEAAVTWP